MIQTLSIQEARKLVLLSQGLPLSQKTGSAKSATLEVISHPGYVQIDTISVIERAHHHILWNRNLRYRTSHLNQLLFDKSILEYWSHAAAYLPMQDFRYSLHRKRALASGELNHWYECDKNLSHSILMRIRSEGSLMAKDFDGSGKKTGGWGSKPAKRALEYLFMLHLQILD